MNYLSLIQIQMIINYPDHEFFSIVSMLPFYKKIEPLNIMELKVCGLKDILRMFNQKVSGKKKELQKRLHKLFDLSIKDSKVILMKNVELYTTVTGHQFAPGLFKIPKRGHIYCIAHGQHVKIGLSKYKTEEQLIKYLTRRYKTPYGFSELSPLNFKCKYYENVVEAEKSMHKKYNEYRLGKSELFTISLGLVIFD